MRIDRVVVEGEDAVALGTFSHVAKATGRPFTTPIAMHLGVKDGLVTRFSFYEDTWAVGAAFGVAAEATESAGDASAKSVTPPG
jgi:ketosteroid isomerase-like protein